MPNSTGGIFQTLVAAATDASAILRFQNAFAESIYWDYQPINAGHYQSLNVIVPTVDEANVIDAGGGPYQPADTVHSNFSITLDKDFTNSFIIRNWDEIRSAPHLRDAYIQPKLEEVLRKVNRSIATLVTTTNFPTYTLISGATDDVFDRANLATAWKNLAGAGAPVGDVENMFFVTNPTAYSGMLASTNWIQESIVGINAAQVAQQNARLSIQLGAQVKWDQHIAGFTANKQPGILMHRYAIAGVTVNPISNAEFKTIVFPKPNIPVMIEMGYSLKDRGWVVGMSCQWGVKVARPELGSLVETA